MGRNGMGKTTLLKCIMGLQAATSGDITFDGTDLLKRQKTSVLFISERKSEIKRGLPLAIL